MAKKVAVSIQVEGFEFVPCDNPDALLDESGEIIIMDVVKGIHEVKVLDDISRIESGAISSSHDFDLGFFLRLMKELGKIEKIQVIALPMDGDEGEISNQVMDCLKRI